ncbi:hypothetical protein Dimus_005708 [Dionaea muscipula]
MANLRTAMDSGFWDLDLSTAQTLHGTAKAVPGQPFPLDRARACKLFRFQQFCLLKDLDRLPLGLLPSLSPPNGSFSVQTLLHCHPFSNGWLGFVGQFSPEKLITSIKNECSVRNERKLPAFRDVAKHFLDKSLYSIGLRSNIPLSPSSSLMLSSEALGDQKGLHNRLLVFHKLPSHDITVEAAWPELFVDNSGKYWHVPESLSLDLASLVSDSGLRYRFGIHSNRGQPRPVFPITGDAPPALMPGLCTKAAFSYQKSKDLWRQKASEEDLILKRNFGTYDLWLQEPHAAVSSIIGGACGAWLGGYSGKDNRVKLESQKRSPLSVDVFGSISCTLQLGKFKRFFLDLTRVDARLDICSASSLAKGFAKYIHRSSSDMGQEDPLSSPRLNVIFRQQVLGPVVFRFDSRIALDSARNGGHQIEDLMYSLSYSLRILGCGKVVAWYSPKRKEGMVELRVCEV